MSNIWSLDPSSCDGTSTENIYRFALSSTCLAWFPKQFLGKGPLIVGHLSPTCVPCASCFFSCQRRKWGGRTSLSSTCLSLVFCFCLSAVLGTEKHHLPTPIYRWAGSNWLMSLQLLSLHSSFAPFLSHGQTRRRVWYFLLFVVNAGFFLAPDLPGSVSTAGIWVCLKIG